MSNYEKKDYRLTYTTYLSIFQTIAFVMTDASHLFFFMLIFNRISINFLLTSLRKLKKGVNLLPFRLENNKNKRIKQLLFTSN